MVITSTFDKSYMNWTLTIVNMSYDESPSQDELKKAYLIKLINMIDTVGWLLADGHHTDAMKVLSSLLARIQIAPEKKDLYTLQEQMVLNFENFISSIQPGQPHRYYYQVSQYMNETYFKELNWARPRIKGEAHLK